MKTTHWTRKEFRQLLGTGVLFLTACVAAGNAQQTNAPPNAADNTTQAKARDALHQTETKLDAAQTNAPAKTAEPAKATADSATEADATDLNNWVEFGVGGTIVSGDKAQYQHQSGLPANKAFGGVQAFHFEEPISKKGLFSIDGRGIFDNHDYDLKLEVQHPDVGYVKTGLRQFREYYDGTGGYFRSSNLSFPPANPQLSLDRGAAYIEAGLTLPDWPVLKIRYEHDFRSGLKDSTEWGTTTLTPGAVQKKITPAYRSIDEKTDSIAVDITHTIKSTDLGVGFRYDWVRNSDSLNASFFPAQGVNSHTLTQTDINKETMLNGHAFTDTKINEQFEFTSGYSYTSMRDKIGGDRLDTPATTGSADTRYANLVGTSDLDQYEMDLSLMWTPREDVFIVPSFRVEKQDIAGTSSDNAVAGNNVIGALSSFRNHDASLDFAESIDARYTGFTNWVLYVRAEWEQDRSNLKLTTLPVTDINRDWHETSQKYTVGANWYPARGLNFSAQYYHKLDDNRYENGTAAPTAYPAFISQERFNIDDANIRMTWRPLMQLTIVPRYDFQYSTVDMRGFNLGTVQAGYNTTHKIGATISWTPINRLYLQLGGNYVLDTTHTPTEGITGGIVQPSKNDYWIADATIGLALNEKTDLRATYSYYRASDYSDNSPAGLPYGAGGEQHTVSATLERKINRALSCALKYSFTQYRDDLFGGNLDYKAHTILSSLRYRF